MGQCNRWFDGLEQSRKQVVGTLRQQCDDAHAQAQQQCNQWRDDGYSRCTETRDDGSNTWTAWQDQGHNICCNWPPCSWFCDALVWVANVVCVAAVWVSNIVCVASVWVSNKVCIGWSGLQHAVCRTATDVLNGAWAAGDAIGRSACNVVEGILNIPQMWDHICASTTARPVLSVPRTSARTFNIATVPNRFSYNDTGQRQDFKIEDGQVFFSRDLGQTWCPVAMEAVSYDRLRRGERFRRPRFDMVAADNGRVLAKEEGVDNFYIAMVDELFWQFADANHPFSDLDHATANAASNEIRVPSSYFKLDPEQFAEGANTGDLQVMPPPSGLFHGHPVAERFDFFRAVMAARDFLAGFVSFMVVVLEPQLWHRLDTRPQRGGGRVPAGLPAYPHITYCDALGQETVQCSIRFDKVLDIAVGHAHWHEQYNLGYGGEIQPLHRHRPIGPVDPGPLMNTYRLFNGPVDDYDGFIDGTCNFYLLCRLDAAGDADEQRCEHSDTQTAPQRFALLFLDEQSYFSQRWRLAHPDDCEGLLFALTPDLFNGFYNFDLKKFWCPFKAGRVTEQSRLAVTRQVVVINGLDPTKNEVQCLYSINFSWATSDYTWRYRTFGNLTTQMLPEADVVNGMEDIAIDETQPESAWPQTVCIRPDTTIHVKGTHRVDGQIVKGRWFQKYLPADCTHPPLFTNNEALPPRFTLDWQFLPESTFERADVFSHFGVYEAVDSRSQYYEVELDDVSVLDGVDESARWEDRDGQLQITQTKFDWSMQPGIADLTALPAKDLDALVHGRLQDVTLLQPPLFQVRKFQSAYNPDRIFLKLARRDKQFIAMHWDKRDDDLAAFDNLPGKVILHHGDKTVSLTLTAPQPLVSIPGIRWAEILFGRGHGSPNQARISLGFSQPPITGLKVWKIKIAAIETTGSVVKLFEAEFATTFIARSNTSALIYDADWEFRDAAEMARAKMYCSQPGRFKYATSLWAIDWAGHVATPDVLGFTDEHPDGEAG